MISILLERLRQGYKTMKFPAAKAPALPDRFCGKPILDCNAISAELPGAEREQLCPTQAIDWANKTVDLGRCIFCKDCSHGVPSGSVEYGQGFALGATRRQDLILDATSEALPLVEKSKKISGLLGRSLKLRQLSAGGCNACEADINVLTTIAWDIGRFGIDIVASPRHADCLVVTGAATDNMLRAIEKTWKAIPEPSFVVAVGSCAISGGIYRGHGCTRDGYTDILPVSLFVPGCPPHPLVILNALLDFLGRNVKTPSKQRA